MSKFYRDQRWLVFRKQVIELDGGSCVQCNRAIDDGVILQVHHKRYKAGKLPWEYAYSDCETMCRGCHAAEHGKIKPRHGWSAIAYEDLGGLVGECELCGTQLRHLHTIFHSNWGALDVGTDCSDELTGTEEASVAKKMHARLIRFVDHKKWIFEHDEHIFRRAGIDIKITGDNFDITGEPTDYGIELNGKAGKKHFPTLFDAKKHVFKIIISGVAKKYLSGSN